MTLGGPWLFLGQTLYSFTDHSSVTTVDWSQSQVYWAKLKAQPYSPFLRNVAQATINTLSSAQASKYFRCDEIYIYLLMFIYCYIYLDYLFDDCNPPTTYLTLK